MVNFTNAKSMAKISDMDTSFLNKKIEHAVKPLEVYFIRG